MNILLWGGVYLADCKGLKMIIKQEHSVVQDTVNLKNLFTQFDQIQN